MKAKVFCLLTLFFAGCAIQVPSQSSRITQNKVEHCQTDWRFYWYGSPADQTCDGQDVVVERVSPTDSTRTTQGKVEHCHRTSEEESSPIHETCDGHDVLVQLSN